MIDDSVMIARVFLRLILAAGALVLLIIDLVWAVFSGTLPLVIAGGLAGTVAGLLVIPEKG